MFDHVGIAVSDLAASERFYRTVLSVLGVEPSHADAEIVEWDDWAIGPADREHPLTRGLHVAFRAPSRAAVDAFWQAGIDAGYRDDGAPGPRTEYGPDYYGGFLLDPDGNSAEAVHDERARAVPDGWIDHVWIRVADLEASKRFYTTIAPHAGIRLRDDEPGRVQFTGEDYSFSLIDDERPVTEHVHLAFPAREDATVRASHAAALEAGYEAPGGPGERAEYHAGYRDDGAPGPRTEYGPDYYGGFLLDPDGNSAEAVHGERSNPVPPGQVDHLWIRVADLAASKRFYTTIAPHAGIRLEDDEPGRVRFTGEDYSLSLIDDERPVTEHVHLAFAAREDATVRAFHAAALAAGYEDHGGPGERPVYHPGYYGAFVLDPDGLNVEVVNHNR